MTMLHELAAQVQSLRLNHNAHREFRMSADEHLAHRRRVGDTPIMATQGTLDTDDLWEVGVTLNDGSSIDVAGSDLPSCVRIVERAIERERALHLAA